MELIEQLQKLQAMREQGALSEEEFTQAKKRVIDAAARATHDASSGAAPLQRASAAINGLQRSWHERWIAGVCGGLAVQTGIPTWTWRILCMLATLLHGFGILIYVLMWIFVPLERPQTEKVVTPDAPTAAPTASATTTPPPVPASANVTNVEPH